MHIRNRLHNAITNFMKELKTLQNASKQTFKNDLQLKKNKALVVLVIFICSLAFGQTKQNITPGFYYGFIEEGSAKHKYLIKVRGDGVVDRMSIPITKKGVKSVTVDAFNDYEYKKTVDVGGITTMQYIKYVEDTQVTTLHKFILIKIDDDTLKIFHMKYHVKQGEEGSSYHYGGEGLFSRDIKGFIKDKRFI